MSVEQILGIALLSIDSFLGVILIIVVLLQGGKIRGIGNAITGTSDSALFGKIKKSEAQKFSIRLTWTIGTCFITFNFILLIFIKASIITL